MKRPVHMTMSELVALPVIADVDTLLSCRSDDPRDHGGTFQDTDGYLWHTVRTLAGWARYPAYLVLLAETRTSAAIGMAPSASVGRRGHCLVFCK